MRGFSFLITWLVFGIPSSAIAVGIGCFLHLSAITIAALVVAIEAMTVRLACSAWQRRMLTFG